MLPLALSTEMGGLIATIVFGSAAIYFTAKQIRTGRFRPKAEAWLAEQCDSLRLKVTNEGSVEGAVHGLEVVDAQGRRISLPNAGESFEKLELSAQSSQEIDFNAPEGRDFQTNDTVVVRWGKREKRLRPTPTEGSFYRAEGKPNEPTPPPEHDR
jgi:hypothetical protein